MKKKKEGNSLKYINSLPSHDFKFFTTLSPTKIQASFSKFFRYFYDLIQLDNQTAVNSDKSTKSLNFRVGWGLKNIESTYNRNIHSSKISGN